MREMSVADQRYLMVLAEGGTMAEMTARWGSSRQTLHTGWARCEDGRDGSVGGSFAPAVAVRPHSDGFGVRGGHHLLVTLPGITADWSFKDNWASTASLVVALFTTVFAGGDALDAIAGTGASSALAVIAVAAALSAGLIGSGPVWLTICKRRYEDADGIARHNTVGGVLLASFFVLLGAVGLVVTAAAALTITAAWLLAGVTTSILLLYSWKSIPQTLALGRFGSQPMAAML